MEDHQEIQPLHNRLSSYSTIHPTRENLPPWKKVLHALDIFAFLPVPRTDPVSTRQSLIGSLLLFTLFLMYLIYGFVEFIISNVPRLNQYNMMTGTSNVTIPDTAIAFFFGDTFDQTYNHNPEYFTISVRQEIKYQDLTRPDFKVTVPLIDCEPDWLSNKFKMLCPEQPLNMSGLMYATPEFIYSRFYVKYCDPTKSADCKPLEDLKKVSILKLKKQITAGGRIILYIKNTAPNINFATGDKFEQLNYTTYQFFLDPGFYLRNEIILQQQTYKQTPDYFLHYTDRVNQFLSFQNEIFYLSDVSVYDKSSGLQVQIRLAQDSLQVDVVYSTILDMISKWGAFWGVLFAGFAFVFLRFNMNRFYKRNPDWEKFDQKIENIVQQPQAITVYPNQVEDIDISLQRRDN